MLYEKLKDKDYTPVVDAVSAILRSRGVTVGVTMYGIVALELFRAELGIDGGLYDALERIAVEGSMKQCVIEYLRSALEASGMTEKDRLPELDQELVRACIANCDAGSFAVMRDTITPSPIVALATEILEIKDEESVADFGCGQGFFLAYAASLHPKASYIGYEINPTNAAVASLRIHALGLDDIVSIECKDLFDAADEAIMFNKIFSHYPMGMRFPRLTSKSEWLREVASGHAGFPRPVVFDWVFNQLVSECLFEGGLGVVLTSDGALVNTSDEKVREYFVEAGCIRTIIEMPKNLLPDTSAGVNLMILGEDTGGITFLDVRKLVSEGRRKNTLSPKAIEVITTFIEDETFNEEADNKRFAEIYGKEPDQEIRSASISYTPNYITCDEDFNRLSREVSSCTASKGAIAQARYKLAIKYYDESMYEDEYASYIGEYFEEHVTEMNRGVTLKASELDEMTVSYNTGIRYLAPTGIVDGLIEEDLPFLARLTPKLEKHALRNGDLLISRIGSPYRIAVAEVAEGEVIIPNSNIFVVRVNPEDVDPYYLAAFLSSSKGEWELSKASSGSTVPSISAKTFMEMEFPYLEPWESEDIVDKYRAKLEEIRLTKARLLRARQDVQDLFN